MRYRTNTMIWDNVSQCDKSNGWRGTWGNGGLLQKQPFHEGIMGYRTNNIHGRNKVTGSKTNCSKWGHLMGSFIGYVTNKMKLWVCLKNGVCPANSMAICMAICMGILMIYWLGRHQGTKAPRPTAFRKQNPWDPPIIKYGNGESPSCRWLSQLKPSISRDVSIKTSIYGVFSDGFPLFS